MSTETVDVVIDSLVNAGVKHIFGVPGAKIDSVFNALIDRPEIKLVVCRHEQNAAFIAGAIGRITGRPGVCIATSGPGTSNLVTGLVTANDEGAPVVALVGDVKRVQAAKKTHQSLRGVQLLEPVTKKTTGAVHPDQISEIMLDAFRTAAAYPQGATAVSLPIDIMTVGTKTSIPALPSKAFIPPEYGTSPSASLSRAASMIQDAKFPVLFLGTRAATPSAVEAVQGFLRKHPIPVVETFQAAGSISQELAHLFYGRIGLFRNQPGDKLLAQADLVIVAGYDQSEYDADAWHKNQSLEILHLDWIPADYGAFYNPKLELVGSIAANVEALSDILAYVSRPQESEVAKAIFTQFHAWEQSPQALGQTGDGPVHPLYFIKLMQGMLPPSPTVASDVGSMYIWLSRFYFAYSPKSFLVSNVQQTLGVALPWAIGASLAQEPPCSRKVVSISGDGGFLYSGQELVTAVQQGCNITHFIWNDGKYNMVEFQEVDKYGRSSGVDLGGVDFVKYAEAFGAKGLRVSRSSELETVMKEALSHEGVCVVDIEIDYSHNHELMKNVIQDNIS
ncbi:acetolactate synthase [Colletotrichum tofieldiae]|uniref:Acetolactate synthase n=1 Tax=Colletotrichum tofieldiae TaxID=708197 RepID=A0A166TE36_9PEZI|nr:acetolactate synthase [Colletotrichum tofieldiae]GKT58430.1 acetolactate synthase [Colletotrichum tofieldiae]GKT78153.1 acetolactate synthase [Colletotrichum tofieldiae]GKT84511.1 acetolactate synthase [Colletotrichum tofieldiae]